MTANDGPVSVGAVVGGRYRVERVLGQGGMAIVYQARHTTTGKACALKLVHAHLVARPDMVLLFVKEAQVGSLIGSNPYIVDVFDAGGDERRGVPFLAMELLEGETLEELVEKRGPMSRDLLRVIVTQLADALDQAHRAGVIHRDLKPSNLFLTHDRRREPVLKVMDFGIAKVLEMEAQRTATQVGTPAYAAPEQLGAGFRKLAAKQGIVIDAGVSPATDVWALGLLVYELLTGLPTGQYWDAETLADLPMRVALEEQDPPSIRAGERAALLPHGFDAWFAYCVKKRASDRWPTAGRAVLELLALLDGKPAVSLAGLTTPGAPMGMVPVTNTPTPGSGPISAPTSGPTSHPEPTPIPAYYVASAQVAVPYRAPAPTASRPTKSGSRAWLAIGAAVGLVALLGLGGFLVHRGITLARDREDCTGGNIQACKDACGLDDAASCRRLGTLYRRGNPPDDARAVKYYRRACDGRDQRGCVELGRMHADGRGGLERDEKAAVDLFDKACDAAEMYGCANLADLLQSGAGVPIDKKRAASLYTKACDGGDAYACASLGAMHFFASGELPKDDKRAAELLQRSCDAGDMWGCYNLGGLLSLGRGGLAKDDARAASLYRAACDDPDRFGCPGLGDFHEAGRGGLARDDKRAVELWKLACDAYRMEGCADLGIAHLRGMGGLAKDDKRGAELLARACDGYASSACAALASMYESGSGGVVKDERRAVDLHRRACDYDHLGSCTSLGLAHEKGKGGLTKDVKRAFDLYKRACDGEDLAGCNNLAMAYSHGQGVAKDERRAAELYERACDAGNAVSCSNAGVLTQEGRGVRKDPSRAAVFYRHGCEGGNAYGCSALGQLYIDGEGVPRDRAQGVELSRKGCRGGDTSGCDRLKTLGVTP